MAKKAQAEFIRWFGPLLDALRDLGDSGRPREVSARISKNLNLPDELLDQTLKSGGSKFHDKLLGQSNILSGKACWIRLTLELGH